MKACYVCGNPLNTKHKSRVKCVCGAKYRVLRNVKIINPRLSYKGTGRQCKIKYLTSSGWIQCKEDASKGSEYCLKHKHMMNKKNPILETIGADILTGVGLGAGFFVAEKVLTGKKK